MHVVLDTNVLVSAIMTPGGIPAQVLNAWLSEQYTLLMSAEALDEIAEVLHRPRVRAQMHYTEQDLGDFLDNLRARSAWLDEVPPMPQLERDPKDTKFVALAVAASANVIVSGDADLLGLRLYEGIPIVTARQFLEELASAS